MRCIEIINNIIPTIPLILENGSKIMHSNGKILYNYPLNYTSLQYLKSILLLNENNINYLCFSSLDNAKYFFYTSKKHYHDLEKKIKYCLKLTTDIDEFLNYAFKNKCTQITIEVIDRGRFIDNDLRFEKSEKSFLHLKEKGVNKGSAIKNLAEYISIPLNDVIIVGNDSNDIEMFRLNVHDAIYVTDDAKPDRVLSAYATKIMNRRELFSYIDNLK